MENMHRNDMRRFHGTINDARQKTAPLPAMCNKEDILLSGKNKGTSWKKHRFKRLINGNNEGVLRNMINIDNQVVEPGGSITTLHLPWSSKVVATCTTYSTYNRCDRHTEIQRFRVRNNSNKKSSGGGEDNPFKRSGLVRSLLRKAEGGQATAHVEPVWIIPFPPRLVCG